MGIRILMKSLIPVKQGQKLKDESDGTNPNLSVKESTARNRDISSLPLSLDSDQDTSVPCETTEALRKGKGKINKEIMNIFVEEEAAASPTSKLAARLPEIPIRDTYNECLACLEWILKFSKHR